MSDRVYTRDCDAAFYSDVVKYGKGIFKNRDKSHGAHHANVVSQYAERILHEDYRHVYEKFYRAVIMIAYFHDANDRKYEDEQGSLTERTKAILEKLYHDYGVVLYRKDDSEIDNPEEFVEMALRIISFISFTKEDNLLKKNIKIDFEAELGRNNALIRYIVSDADKIDSLGIGGITRCETYTVETWKSKGIIYSQEQLHIEIKRLFDTRFDRLIAEFLHTNHGKELAEPLLEEMKTGLVVRGIL